MFIKAGFCYLLPLYKYCNRISLTWHNCPTLATPCNWFVIVRDLVRLLFFSNNWYLDIISQVALLLKLANLLFSSIKMISSSCYCKLVSLYYALLFLLKLANLLLNSIKSISGNCYCKLVGLHYAFLFLLKLINFLVSSTETISSNGKPSPIFLCIVQLFNNSGLFFFKLPDYKFELFCFCGIVFCYLNQIGLIIKAFLVILNNRLVSGDSFASFIKLLL